MKGKKLPKNNYLESRELLKRVSDANMEIKQTKHHFTMKMHISMNELVNC